MDAATDIVTTLEKIVQKSDFLDCIGFATFHLANKFFFLESSKSEKCQDCQRWHPYESNEQLGSCHDDDDDDDSDLLMLERRRCTTTNGGGGFDHHTITHLRFVEAPKLLQEPAEKRMCAKREKRGEWDAQLGLLDFLSEFVSAVQWNPARAK